ncbi:MAG: hypothetical protein Q9222_000596 [Ikaeria aurantiellina]
MTQANPPNRGEPGAVALMKQQDAEADRTMRLKLIQMEALGTSRRDQISTDEIPSRDSAFLSMRDVELQRRVNQQGTKENKGAQKLMEKLHGWNTAWSNLKDDENLEAGLEDLNAGQTHRGRLLSAAPLLSAATSQTHHHDGAPSRIRASGRGGRGGGNVGSQPTRFARKRNGTVTLVPPSQFMSHQFTSIPPPTSITEKSPSSGSKPLSFAEPTVSPAPIDVPTAKDTTSGSKAAQAGSETAGLPASSLAASPERSLRLVSTKGATKPAPLPLSEAETSSSETIREPNPPKSYVEDLLDMDIKETYELPAPLSVHGIAKESAPHSAPSITPVHQQQIMDQLTAFLPSLRSILPAEILQHLKNTLSNLQKTTFASAQRTDGFATQRPRLNSNPQLGLSQAVEDRTKAWAHQVVKGNTPSGISIFGEHITRSRFATGEGSVTSVASVASPIGSPALTERIENFHLEEPAPSLVTGQPPGNAQRPRSTSTDERSRTKGSPSSTLSKEGHGVLYHRVPEEGQEENMIPFRRVSTEIKPQIPEFLRNSVRDQKLPVNVETAIPGTLSLQKNSRPTMAAAQILDHESSSQKLSERPVGGTLATRNPFLQSSIAGERSSEAAPNSITLRSSSLRARASENTHPLIAAQLSLGPSNKSPHHRESSKSSSGLTPSPGIGEDIVRARPGIGYPFPKQEVTSVPHAVPSPRLLVSSGPRMLDFRASRQSAANPDPAVPDRRRPLPQSRPRLPSFLTDPPVAADRAPSQVPQSSSRVRSGPGLPDFLANHPAVKND